MRKKNTQGRLPNKPGAFFYLNLAALLLLLTAGGCKGANDGTGSNTSMNPLPPVGGPPKSNAMFFASVTLPDANSPYFFHEQSSLTAPCSVPIGTPAGPAADIYCILDIQELDLYFGGLTFFYNLPQTMCNYFELMPYSFYMLPVATPSPLSQTVVSIKVNANGTIALQTVTVGGNPSPLLASFSSGQVICPFDYTNVVKNGQNCCVGSYTLDQVNAAGPDTFSSGNFSGDPTRCLAGPAVDTQPKDVNNFPAKSYVNVAGTGLYNSYAVKSPISRSNGSNIYPANWFTPTTFANGSNALPATLFPASIASTRNPYYQFGCVDRADDYIARIRILVRSWDKTSNFTAQSNPYNPGTPEPQFGTGFHDRSVWDDTTTASFPGFPGLNY